MADVLFLHCSLVSNYSPEYIAYDFWLNACSISFS